MQQHDRRPVIVDVETAGRTPGVHDVVECAWWDIETDERGVFVPPHSMIEFEAEALSINRYYERRLWYQSTWDDGTELERLHQTLTGNLLVGSNPGFDALMLAPLFTRFGFNPRPWKSVPLDIGTYAAGVLSLPIGDRTNLTALCETLHVEPGKHCAWSDVQAIGEVLLKLHQHINLRKVA